MDFVQAQFSLKYEPNIKIRRAANDIEDFLQHYYGTPQMMPIPDEIAPEAPRISLYSKNGHSQISFSQISVDFVVKFDNDYVSDFKKTREYSTKRIQLIIDLLKHIGISEYLFCGISYIVRLDIEGKKPVDFLRHYLGENLPQEELYEASQGMATVLDNQYFINQKIGTYKEFKGMPGAIPDLFNIATSTVISEGVSLVLDVNNRYRWLYDKSKSAMDGCARDADKLYEILADKLNNWR